MTKTERITWEEYTNDIIHAYNLDKELLGCLVYENVGRHMHWCWYQQQDIRMSPGCLQEVRDKQKKLFNLKRLQSLSSYERKLLL